MDEEKALLLGIAIPQVVADRAIVILVGNHPLAVVEAGAAHPGFAIGDLAQRSDQEMLKTKNFGRKSLNEIKALLSEMDLTLGMKFEGWIRPEIPEKVKE